MCCRNPKSPPALTTSCKATDNFWSSDLKWEGHAGMSKATSGGCDVLRHLCSQAWTLSWSAHPDAHNTACSTRMTHWSRSNGPGRPGREMASASRARVSETPGAAFGGAGSTTGEGSCGATLECPQPAGGIGPDELGAGGGGLTRYLMSVYGHGCTWTAGAGGLAVKQAGGALGCACCDALTSRFEFWVKHLEPPLPRAG